MSEEDAVLMACQSEICCWTGTLGEVILRPHARESLVCPVCGEAVLFVEEP